MSMVDISWRPDPQALRKFGLVVMIGLGIIGLLVQFWFDNPSAATFIYFSGPVLGLPALSGTVIGLPGYWLWMGVAFVMGNFMSRVLLTLIYYVLITPIAIGRRLLGNDKLRLRKPPVDSYWSDVEMDNDLARFERQF
jgi:hypothetical protein